MLVKVLVENGACSPEFGCEHGLSLYLEAGGLKILMDAGQGTLFLENARKLGVPVEDADLMVLSHGHYDHGGGLGAFLEVNHEAPVYVQRSAFGPLYSQAEGQPARYIGLDPALRDHPQIRLLDGDFTVAPNLFLFSSVPLVSPPAPSNRTLREEVDSALVPDRLMHEQSLIVQEGEKLYLLAGCAHHGIAAILDRCREIAKKSPDAALGGFHLSGPGTPGALPDEALKALAERLAAHQTVYYTGHCTGEDATERLSRMLPGRIRRLNAGLTFSI
jgi:7,8-dihydropterin-6-yl-methyl-4-(beta-D-ribofuranosyl)aminobenzene 5'-phosphate synthase